MEYNFSEIDPLLRQAQYYRMQARQILDDGADYQAAFKKMCLSNQCILTANGMAKEVLAEPNIELAMHLMMMAKIDD